MRVFVLLGKKNSTSVSVVRNWPTIHTAMLHDIPDKTGSARLRCRTVANSVFLPCVFIAPLDFPAVHTRTYIHAYGLPTITTSSK